MIRKPDPEVEKVLDRFAETMFRLMLDHHQRQAVEMAMTLPQAQALRLLMGGPPPDVVKTLLYRREFFGKPIGDLFQAVLRGPSEWSVGERELFAAFVSRLKHLYFGLRMGPGDRPCCCASSADQVDAHRALARPYQ